MIFSDNFTVAEKFSIKKKQRICSFSMMPWSCTSLYDSCYKPELDEETKSKLNSVFRYKYFNTNNFPIYDELKYFGVDHEGDDIQRYYSRFCLNYSEIRRNNLSWNHFLSTTGFDIITSCTEKLDKLTSITDAICTDFVGIEYNKQLKPEYIYIVDTSYDLNEYDENVHIKKLNELCNTNFRYVTGIIGLSADSNKMKFILDLQYPDWALELDPENASTPSKLKFEPQTSFITYSQGAIRHLRAVAGYGFINEDDESYILTLMPKEVPSEEEFKIDLEFEFDEDGNLEDIVLIRYIYEEFEKCNENIHFRRSPSGQS